MKDSVEKRVVILGAMPRSLVNFRGPLIRDLVARGYHVVAAAPECEGAIADSLRALGAEPISVPVARVGMNPLSDLAYLRSLEALFRRTRPTAIIPYTAKPVIWGSIAASRAGVPTIVPMITGLGYAFSEGREAKRRFLRTVMSFLYRRALSRASAIIFQNPDDRQEFVGLGLVDNGKTHVVAGSGIDVESFPHVPVPERPSFLMLCRLLREKGVREYAEAAAILARDHPEVRIRLLGPVDRTPSGVSPEDVARWSGGACEYGGSVDNVRPALAECSVYVLPSYYREGIPRSSLEALATGRAIVTTDSPGCRETVSDGENGILVPARDAPALARAMKQLIQNPTLAVEMGVRSRRLAEDRFDVRKVNCDILRIAGLDGSGDAGPKGC